MTPRRRIPLRRKIIYSAIILAAALAIALGVVELLARVAVPLKVPWVSFWPRGYYVAAKECRYHPAPDFPPTWMKGKEQLRNLCYSNSLGMHDVEPPAPGPQQLRILCLGCSFTEGYWLSTPEQTWPRQLAKCLNGGAGPTSATVAVMNAGVVGYNTFQQVAHAAHLSKKVKSDVWLMAYMGGKVGMWSRNDFGPDGLYRLRWGILWDVDHLSTLRGGRSAASLWLMDHSYYWRWYCLTRTDWSPTARKTDYAAYHHDYERATWEALSQFQQQAERAGAAPVLVYLPVFEEIGNQLAGRVDLEAVIIPLKLAEMCAKLKLPLIDLREAMTQSARGLKAGEFPGIWRASAADPHYKADCNAVFARNLAERIRPLMAEWMGRSRQ